MRVEGDGWGIQRSSKSKVNPNRISMSRLNTRAAFVPKFQRRRLEFLGACVSKLSNELTTRSLEAGKLQRRRGSAAEAICDAIHREISLMRAEWFIFCLMRITFLISNLNVMDTGNDTANLIKGIEE